MTQLEQLRVMLDNAQEKYREFFNTSDQCFYIVVRQCHKPDLEIVFNFTKDQVLDNVYIGFTYRPQEAQPNVPAPEPEIPFGGHMPQIPSWYKEQQ